MPVVGAREPCPCGSGRRYKACHGRSRATAPPPRRPFRGLPGEADWVALREIVPAATAPVSLTGEYAGRQATVATVLPLGWPAMVRADGAVFVGLQVTGSSGDPGRDVAAALVEALSAERGTAVTDVPRDEAAPTLAELVGAEPFDVTVHAGFDYWVEGVPDPEGTVSASLERANASVVPTQRLATVDAAYWARIGSREHLRWVLPEDEDAVLDALVRLHLRGALGLFAKDDQIGRYVGAFRADGLLVPVWDLVPGTEAPALEEPAQHFRAHLDEALADSTALDAAGRRTRAGLIGRQVTLR
ncbi:MAG: DUF5926 family protein [Actinomycetes bacterium]